MSMAKGFQKWGGGFPKSFLRNSSRVILTWRLGNFSQFAARFQFETLRRWGITLFNQTTGNIMFAAAHAKQTPTPTLPQIQNTPMVVDSEEERLEATQPLMVDMVQQVTHQIWNSTDPLRLHTSLLGKAALNFVLVSLSPNLLPSKRLQNKQQPNLRYIHFYFILDSYIDRWNCLTRSSKPFSVMRSRLWSSSTRSRNLAWHWICPKKFGKVPLKTVRKEFLIFGLTLLGSALRDALFALWNSDEWDQGIVKTAMTNVAFTSKFSAALKTVSLFHHQNVHILILC